MRRALYLQGAAWYAYGVAISIAFGVFDAAGIGFLKWLAVGQVGSTLLALLWIATADARERTRRIQQEGGRAATPSYRLLAFVFLFNLAIAITLAAIAEQERAAEIVLAGVLLGVAILVTMGVMWRFWRRSLERAGLRW